MDITMDILGFIGFTSICSGLVLRMFDSIAEWHKKKHNTKTAEEVEKEKRDEALLIAVTFLLERQVTHDIHKSINNGYRLEVEHNQLKKGYNALEVLDDKEGNIKELYENEYMELPLRKHPYEVKL